MDLQNVPEEYKEIYTRHYNTIQTRVSRGRIKYVYHFMLTENYTPSLVEEYLAVIRGEHENGCKVNAAFGFILKNVDTQELKFFHPSNNNKQRPTTATTSRTQIRTSIAPKVSTRPSNCHANIF